VTADPETDPRIVRVRRAGEPAPPDVETTAPLDPGRAAAADHRLRVRDTLIEKIIRDAQAAGQFDDLPYQGQRLPLEDDSAAGEMASAFRILRNAGAAPEWIETDKEIRRLLAERDVLRDRAGRAGPLMRERYRKQLRALVTDINRLVFVLNHEAPSPRQHRRPLDAEHELADLEARFPQ
jgi:hypothetical protein